MHIGTTRHWLGSTRCVDSVMRAFRRLKAILWDEAGKSVIARGSSEDRARAKGMSQTQWYRAWIAAYCF